MKTMVTWEDFDKVDFRVGTIVEVSDFPRAHLPAYRLYIDFGEGLGIKKSSARITDLYTKETLVGKQIVAVVNFPEKQIADFRSECLVLGAISDEGVALLGPSTEVANGSMIT